MLGKLKKVLGIEGVKLEIVLDQDSKIQNELSGILKFSTKTNSSVQSITIKIIEKYTRGRGKSKLIDEYIIGSHVLEESFDIASDEVIEIPFAMPFERVLSPMDAMQKDNFVARPFIGLAKLIKKVKSEFFILAEADVPGTTLDPFDKKQFSIK